MKFIFNILLYNILFYFIFYERAQRVKYCFYHSNKIHIFKLPCNFLFIIWTRIVIPYFLFCNIFSISIVKV